MDDPAKRFGPKDLRLKLSHSLVSRGEGGLEEEGARLLESIKRFGSIYLAAKQEGVDYKLAWLGLREIERNFGFKVVERVMGGVGGGSTRLTLEGEILLGKYLLARRKLGSIAGSPKFLEPDLKIMGSHCCALDVLARLIEEIRPLRRGRRLGHTPLRSVRWRIQRLFAQRTYRREEDSAHQGVFEDAGDNREGRQSEGDRILGGPSKGRRRLHKQEQGIRDEDPFRRGDKEAFFGKGGWVRRIGQGDKGLRNRGQVPPRSSLRR
ncbi:MAG: LysR family transcriptional regulator [Candidatus Brockarchaeota archaeon]|nr:LysR family transcriptional regulator [Candidatus Brockarchaeota archaeon]